MLRRIKVQKLDATTAAPFGTAIDSAVETRDLDFQCDGCAQLTLLRYPFKQLRTSVFERHHHVGQGFFILEGIAAVAIVAPPTPGCDRPDPDAVAALLLKPGTGILLHRGVWHALDRYAVAPPFATGVLLTERETSDDFTRHAAGQRPARSDVVDLKALDGIEFAVDLG